MRKHQQIVHTLREVERIALLDVRMRRMLKAAPLVLVFALLSARPSRAACVFNPSPDPTVDGAPASLRAAVQSANAARQNCTIKLAAGTYTLTIKNTNGQDNTAAEGDLDITSSGHTTTIVGASETGTIVNANGIDRAFQVLGGANATFKNLTIEGGIAQDNGTAGALPGTTESDGGGVLVQGNAKLNFFQVAIQNNQAIGRRRAAGSRTPGTSFGRGGVPGGVGDSAFGGGLYLSSGAVDLKSSKILNNSVMGGSGGPGILVAYDPYATTPARGGNGGPGAGGGLYILSGNLNVSRSTVEGNNSVGGAGGGFGENGGNSFSVLIGSSGDGSSAKGAGIHVAGGVIRIAQSTITRNASEGGKGGGGTAGAVGYGFGSLFLGGHQPAGTGGEAAGAGLYASAGDITLADSTIADNAANGGAGGFYNPGHPGTRYSGSHSIQGFGGQAEGGGLYAIGGEVALSGTTIASNQALGASIEPAPAGTSSGGGIDNAGATITSDTTLIGNNTQDTGNASNGDDVFGAISSSFTLIGDSAGAVITDDGNNILDVDPGLDPKGLQRNGGPTETIALTNTSPAIDKGDAAVCAEAPALGGLGSVDQRGFHRFDSGDSFCDIGAFEVNKAARGIH